MIEQSSENKYTLLCMLNEFENHIYINKHKRTMTELFYYSLLSRCDPLTNIAALKIAKMFLLISP